MEFADDIHSYPPADLLKLLAHILTHIASTNDHLPSNHDIPHPHHPPIWHSLTVAARSALTTPSATLTFHARNIPTISLEAYLLRILKYCPTSNHVFLSLLVYFDRMSKLSFQSVGRPFVIDSYNIHRLVIAGVTVASKFFSDVFYTNSRYAKVGGLPLPELNQLELQFLLLNDFRLFISSADMQNYAEQLILFSEASPPPNAPDLMLPEIARRRRPPQQIIRSMHNGHVSHPRRTTTHHNHSHRNSNELPSGSRTTTSPNGSTTTDTDKEAADADQDQDDEPETEPETETETETTTSTSTDDDSEPTIRGPRTVVGWGDDGEGREGDRSP